MSNLNKLQFENILNNYDLGKLFNAVELSPGFANRNYRVECEVGDVLVRWVLEKDLHDLQRELHLLNSLKSINFPTAYPISKKDGKFISSLSKGYVVIYDFIPGEHPKPGKSQALAVGAVIGQLSTFLPPPDFRPRNTINMEACMTLSNELSEAPNQLPDIFNYFTKHTQHLERRIGLGLPEGLIHADVFPDNTIFQGHKLKAIIDFEEACWDELLFDLAMTINGFCFSMNKLSYPLLDSILLGYCQKRKLSTDEWHALPVYIQWTAHGMLSWHLQKLSQVPNQRQEKRVRELMARVMNLKKHENELAEYFKLQSIELEVD